ncbi:MAG TPA: molecular chaperone TorD family protein [Thermodesulfobacteriota bacterium]|nr:molecular chaperone TorD family protein [Thermodesulfobacteriota bacterium]
MTSEERERFSEILARVFSPPDREMVEQIHLGNIHSFFHRYLQIWGEDSDMLQGFLIEGDSEIILRDLEEEYSRLFSSETGSEAIPLVESFYKPWTQDPHCPLPFATEKGLLMGDSALHLLSIYKQCGLEVAEEYKGMPDHLVAELEFLSFLCQWATDKEIRRFIEDHLDWTPLLREEFKEFHPHPFYRSALEVLILILNKEKERLEVEESGKKEIY